MKLIVVRHGETEANVKKINQGSRPGKLTKKGISQADKLGKRLAKEKIDIIYCSDLGRTKETLQEIIKHVKAPVKFIPAIRERNMGVFEGKKYGYMRQFIKKNNFDIYTFRPEGGESRADVQKRALNFLKKCKKNHFGKTVLWITHGGIMMRMNTHLLNIDDSYFQKVHPSNCALSIFEFKKNNKHEVKVINCVKHLKKSRKKTANKRKKSK